MYRVALIHGLREGPLKFEANVRAPRTYQELIGLANSYIRGEKSNPSFVSRLVTERNQPYKQPSRSHRKDFPSHSRKIKKFQHHHQRSFPGQDRAHEQLLLLPAPPQQTAYVHHSQDDDLSCSGLDEAVLEACQIMRDKANSKRSYQSANQRSRDSDPFCEFHREKGHLTEECNALRRLVEKLLVEGKINDLVKKVYASKPSTSKGKEVAEVQMKCVEITDVGHLGPIDDQSECIDVIDEGPLGRLF
ncbi:hypothetical protein KSP39_PZI020997 [Platanthera zijinensis]|uniref:Reverse transcriptase domain-containing protein n=1 Tax=Platanthera zijinensis TaxID=2320716 RepID=A0AAP0AXJ1_9ASPA